MSVSNEKNKKFNEIKNDHLFLELLKNLKIYKKWNYMNISKNDFKSYFGTLQWCIDKYNYFFIGLMIKNEINLKFIEEYFENDNNALAIVYFDNKNFINNSCCFIHILFKNKIEFNDFDIFNILNNEDGKGRLCDTIFCDCFQDHLICKNIYTKIDIFYSIENYKNLVLNNINDNCILEANNTWIFWKTEYSGLHGDIIDWYCCGIVLEDHQTWFPKPFLKKKYKINYNWFTT